MICVECGDESASLLDGCCAKCYVKHTPILQVPEFLDLEFCAHCGARHVGSHWHDVAEDMPIEWIRQESSRQAIQVHSELRNVVLEDEEIQQDAKHFKVNARVHGTLEGLPVSDEASFTTRVRRGVCDRCSRRMGGYWAALIQLRATDRHVSERELERSHKVVAEELHRGLTSGNRLAFLQKESAMHGGWDYYIGDIDAARNVSRILQGRLNAKVQETAKLVGRRNGEDVYRVTFLVRIQLFAPGDIAIDRDDTLLQIIAADAGRAQAHRFVDHRKTRAMEDQIRRLGGPEILQDAIVVSQDAANIQVLDPDTLVAIDLPKPAGYNTDAETVSVLRFEERLYLAPRSVSKSS